MARGRYIAFLTQDAVPLDEHWLSELLAPFEIDDRVAIVTGRQIPRDSAFPLQKYDITQTFASIGSSRGHRRVRGRSAPTVREKEFETAAFHSDVNAAVRRDLATTDIPFRDVPYSEDQLMGREVLQAGLWKAYAGRAAVEHSNDLTLREYGKRLFDETVALRSIGHDYSATTLVRMVKAITFGTLGDTVKILRDRDYRVPQKLRWWVVNPAFHVQRWVSTYRAAHINLADDSLLRSRFARARTQTHPNPREGRSARGHGTRRVELKDSDSRRSGAMSKATGARASMRGPPVEVVASEYSRCRPPPNAVRGRLTVNVWSPAPVGSRRLDLGC